LGTFLRAQSAINRVGAGAADMVDVPLGTFLRAQSAIDRVEDADVSSAGSRAAGR
jgi:hypothetical protein